MNVLSIEELSKDGNKVVKQNYYNLNKIASLTGEDIDLSSDESQLDKIKALIMDDNTSYEEIQEQANSFETQVSKDVKLSVSFGDMVKEYYFELAKVKLIKL